MSQQASPKSNVIQTLLLMAVIFLGMQLLCRPAPEDKRPLSEVMTSVRKLEKDLAAAPASDDYAHKISSEIAEARKKLDAGGDMPKAERDSQKLELEVISARSQYLHALAKKDFYQAQMGYQTLHNDERSHGMGAEWDKPISVTPSDIDKRSTVTLRALYDDLAKQAHELGKTTLVWGFMPGYQMIDGLVNMTGAVPAFSYAFAALLLALAVRAIIWPLAQKQYMWSRQMSQLQPLVKELKDRYEGQELNMKIMELYREYGINPMAGCGPALLQMPLFLLIYNCMLHYKFEFTKGYFLWINPSTSASVGGWIAPNLGERDYILLVIYGASMIVTTLLTPVSDPSNVRQQRLMGIGIAVFFTFLMFTGVFPVPAAFVLYWIFTNVFSTFQSLRAYRLPLPPLTKVNTKEGGVLPRDPVKNGKVEDTIRTDAFKGTGAPKLHKPKRKKK
jgi:YidC/Oxa1 family membrane protein insertase